MSRLFYLKKKKKKKKKKTATKKIKIKMLSAAVCDSCFKGQPSILTKMRKRKKKVSNIYKFTTREGILTVCMLGNFACFFIVCGLFFKLTY